MLKSYCYIDKKAEHVRELQNYYLLRTMQRYSIQRPIPLRLCGVVCSPSIRRIIVRILRVPWLLVSTLQQRCLSVVRAVGIGAPSIVSTLWNKVAFVPSSHGRHGHTLHLSFSDLLWRQLTTVDALGHAQVVEEGEEVEGISKCDGPFKDG